MKFIFDTKYSEIELEFLNRHNCQILSEIQLSKTDFSKHEIPRRMFRYGGEYIGEICHGESGGYVWAVLSKWKSVYRFTSYYEDLQALEQNL